MGRNSKPSKNDGRYPKDWDSDEWGSRRNRRGSHDRTYSDDSEPERHTRRRQTSNKRQSEDREYSDPPSHHGDTGSKPHRSSTGRDVRGWGNDKFSSQLPGQYCEATPIDLFCADDLKDAYPDTSATFDFPGPQDVQYLNAKGVRIPSLGAGSKGKPSRPSGVSSGHPPAPNSRESSQPLRKRASFAEDTGSHRERDELWTYMARPVEAFVSLNSLIQTFSGSTRAIKEASRSALARAIVSQGERNKKPFSGNFDEEFRGIVDDFTRALTSIRNTGWTLPQTREVNTMVRAYFGKGLTPEQR